MVNKNLRCKINTFFLIVQLFVLLVIVISLIGVIRPIMLIVDNQQVCEANKHNSKFTCVLLGKNRLYKQMFVN